MTTHRMRRCHHCMVTYAYQSSGPDCHEETNDRDYCPECKAVIVEALRTVPRRVEQFWEVVTGKEADQVLEKKKQNEEDVARRRAAGQIIGVRIGMPLFDLQSGASSSCVFVHLDGVEYTVTTWSDDREPARVHRSMERDLQTGKTRPWYDPND